MRDRVRKILYIRHCGVAGRDLFGIHDVMGVP